MLIVWLRPLYVKLLKPLSDVTFLKKKNASGSRWFSKLNLQAPSCR